MRSFISSRSFSCESIFVRWTAKVCEDSRFLANVDFSSCFIHFNSAWSCRRVSAHARQCERWLALGCVRARVHVKAERRACTAGLTVPSWISSLRTPLLLRARGMREAGGDHAARALGVL